MRARRPTGTLCLQVAARVLASRGVPTDSRRIFRQLQDLGLMDGRHAKIDAIKRGLLVEELGDFTYRGERAGQDVYTRVFLTRQGLAKLEEDLLRSVWRPHCDVELGIERCVLGL